MAATAIIKSRIKAARKRGAYWVRVFDFVRLAVSSEGRARLWTKVVHRGKVHQTTPHTCEDRYPELFDLAAELAPKAKRILSFGCSTGEELVALRRRFPAAIIVGAEINPRSRRIAARRVVADNSTEVIRPGRIEGEFEVIFALAVLQREPQKIVETDSQDISRHYPFQRFDAAVGSLVDHLCTGGLLCVANAQYCVEQSSAAPRLSAVRRSPLMQGSLFAPDGRRLAKPLAKTIFRKR